MAKSAGQGGFDITLGKSGRAPSTQRDVRAIAFDAHAESYDSTFTQTILGRVLRLRVWQRLAAHYQPGHCVLDIGCGTGEDSLWLAQRDVEVTALDVSPEMIRKTVAKLGEAGGLGIEVATGSVEHVLAGFRRNGRLFDGAYSNFGALNCVQDLNLFGESLAQVLRPGAKVVLVPMSPFCPAEIVWMVLRGRPRQALRRIQGQVEARIGQHIVTIHYPSLLALKSHLAAWFMFTHAESLGLLLPTSQFAARMENYPALLQRLNRIEQSLGRYTLGCGDHYIAEFTRK